MIETENERKLVTGEREKLSKYNLALRGFGLALLLIGATFYFSWSILYNTWADVGLYSFTVVMVVFGLLTLMLAQEKAKKK